MKIINLASVATANSSNTELIYRKATAIDKTRNVSLTFYESSTSIPKEDSIYQITHILISLFNYERILKTTARTTADLWDNEKVTINVPEDVLTSFRAVVNETKIVALHQESLQKTYLCSPLKSSMVSDEDDIIESSCPYGVIASVDASTPNTIESKQRIELQVKLEQLDACYLFLSRLLFLRHWMRWSRPKEKTKVLKTKVNFTYDRDAMVVIALEVAKKNN